MSKLTYIWDLGCRKEMTTKNAAELAYSHEHRNPCSSLRLGAEVMGIYSKNKTNKNKTSFNTVTSSENEMRKEPTPSNGKSNSGIRSTYNAECSKVLNMVIVCDRKPKSKKKRR